jgi:hypothetical protein
VLLTPHRSLLVPILVHHELGGRIVPDILSAQPQPLPPDTCLQIPAAVVAVRNLCNPLRAAEAQSTAGSSRAVRSRKR